VICLGQRGGAVRSPAVASPPAGLWLPGDPCCSSPASRRYSGATRTSDCIPCESRSSSDSRPPCGLARSPRRRLGVPALLLRRAGTQLRLPRCLPDPRPWWRVTRSRGDPPLRSPSAERMGVGGRVRSTGPGFCHEIGFEPAELLGNRARGYEQCYGRNRRIEQWTRLPEGISARAAAPFSSARGLRGAVEASGRVRPRGGVG
jgi:hypothetical protein